MQPKVEVVAKQHTLDAVVEAQVLHHSSMQGGMQAGIGTQVRDGLGGARLGQQHWLIGRVVGLEDRPVLAGQHALLHLTGPRHVEQWGLGVDAAVLQAQVRMQEKREAFELCTQQAVLIGLQRCGVGEQLSGTVEISKANNIYCFTGATVSLTEHTHTHNTCVYTRNYTQAQIHIDTDKHMLTNMHIQIDIYR